MAPAIGIDLGTCYSCVGTFRDGAVEIIPNSYGKRVSPSYVAFRGDERLLEIQVEHHGEQKKFLPEEISWCAFELDGVKNIMDKRAEQPTDGQGVSRGRM